LIELAFAELDRELLLVMTPPDKTRRFGAAGCRMWLLKSGTAERCDVKHRVRPDVTVLYKLHGGIDPEGHLGGH
jgi:hypothetical protein